MPINAILPIFIPKKKTIYIHITIILLDIHEWYLKFTFYSTREITRGCMRYIRSHSLSEFYTFFRMLHTYNRCVLLLPSQISFSLFFCMPFLRNKKIVRQFVSNKLKLKLIINKIQKVHTKII